MNVLLVASLLSLGYTAMREYSVRRYLKGFSDAIVPHTASPEAKVEAILTWMRSGPARPVAVHPNELGPRDPENTLNYQQLLAVCGTATNAFLNLARSAGLDARRLLLLTPERFAKHVVSEVLIDDRWIVVDATYRVILRDAQGRMLTRRELQNPEIFAQATGKIPNYLPIYDYQSFAHVRIARLPMDGLGLRRMLQAVYPGWDEAADWSLLLERESFFYFFTSALLSLLLVGARIILAWYADRHLRVSRFRVRHQVARAGATFFSAPELKE